MNQKGSATVILLVVLVAVLAFLWPKEYKPTYSYLDENGSKAIRQYTCFGFTYTSGGGELPGDPGLTRHCLGFPYQKSANSQDARPTPTKTATPTATSKIVTLTSPKNGAIYSSEIRIAGKTKPGYYIQVYANYSAKDLQCLTFNSFSNGGAGQVNANGNFDFALNYQGYKSGQNTLVVAALQNSRVETCFPANNVSDVITYTYAGSIPNP